MLLVALFLEVSYHSLTKAALTCAGNEHEINYPSVTFCKNRELNAKCREFIRKRRELHFSRQIL